MLTLVYTIYLYHLKRRNQIFLKIFTIFTCIIPRKNHLLPPF
jgi:hypothetical protein